MTAAVIDIGSNSVLLLASDGDSALLTTRLGAGLRAGGCLDDQAKERTRSAVIALATRSRDRKVRSIAAFGTGALRRATDGGAFARTLADAAAIPVHILSGDDEAVWAYRAARIGTGPSAVIDVGGGTTEITLGSGDVIVEAVSVPLGALALTEAGETPRTTIDAVLQPLRVIKRLRAEQVPLIASGGTATALAALDLNLPHYDPARVHGHRLTRAAIERLAAQVRATPPATLDPGRADILPAGALILSAVMDAAATAAVTVSDCGVRHAYLEHWLRMQ